MPGNDFLTIKNAIIIPNNADIGVEVKAIARVSFMDSFPTSKTYLKLSRVNWLFIPQAFVNAPQNIVAYISTIKIETIMHNVNNIHFAEVLTLFTCEVVGFPVTVMYFFLFTQYFCRINAINEGTSNHTANAAPFFRLNMPVISKYACTDKTGKLAPAKIKGFPKSAKDSIKRTSMVLAIPGTDNGRVTFVNTCHLDAFRLNAASSSVGDIVDSTPSKVMKQEKGNNLGYHKAPEPIYWECSYTK